jgi:hypothetical protein
VLDLLGKLRHNQMRNKPPAAKAGPPSPEHKKEEEQGRKPNFLERKRFVDYGEQESAPVTKEVKGGLVIESKPEIVEEAVASNSKKPAKSEPVKAAAPP